MQVPNVHYAPGTWHWSRATRGRRVYCPRCRYRGWLRSNPTRRHTFTAEEGAFTGGEVQQFERVGGRMRYKRSLFNRTQGGAGAAEASAGETAKISRKRLQNIRGITDIERRPSQLADRLGLRRGFFGTRTPAHTHIHTCNYRHRKLHKLPSQTWYTHHRLRQYVSACHQSEAVALSPQALKVTGAEQDKKTIAVGQEVPHVSFNHQSPLQDIWR